MRLIEALAGDSQEGASICFPLDFDLDNARYALYGAGDGPSITQCKRLAGPQMREFLAAGGSKLKVTGWEIEATDEMDGVWSCLLVGNLQGPFDVASLKQISAASTDDEWYIAYRAPGTDQFYDIAEVGI